MKRLIKRALFLFLFPLLAVGQGIITQPKTVTGTINGITRPIPSATITVCASGIAGLPCSPALMNAVFRDAALTQPLSNPFPADASGNYQFAAVPGTYTVTETATGFTGYTYQLQLPSSCVPIGSCAAVAANNVFTGNNTMGSLNTILFVDGVKYTTFAAALAAATSFSEIYLPPGNYTINNSAGPLVISQNQIYIHGAGRGNTTLTCNTAANDCLQFTGAKSRVEGLSMAYSSQAASGAYTWRITNTGQMRAVQVYMETNIGSGVLIEDTLANPTENVNDNDFQRVIIGACTGNGMVLSGSAINRRVLNTTLDETQILSCSGLAPSNGLLINDWVQGTYVKNNAIFQFTDRPIFINPTAANRSFDIFITNTTFDATVTREQIRAINTSDLRILNSWFGQAGTGFYQVYIDSNSTDVDIIGNYFGFQTVAQPGDVFLNGNTTRVKLNRFIQSTAPTTAMVVVNTGASFNDVVSNTFEGVTPAKWVSDSGTSTRIGPNYGDQASPTNAAVFGTPLTDTNALLTTPTLTGLTNGTGLQLFNTTTTCTTGASVGAICTTGAITLPVAYADTNYRLSCTGQGVTNVPIVQTYAKSNTTFTITIAALTAAAATFTSYDCSAVHN